MAVSHHYYTGSYTPCLHSGGGAGSGGTIYLVAENMNVTPASIGEGASANGATFAVSGGTGGGWRT